MDLELIERNVGHKGSSLFIPAKPHFLCFIILMRERQRYHSCMSRHLIKPITRDVGPGTENGVE